MKKTATLLLLSLWLCSCSSIPQEAFTQANDNALISDAYIVLMDQNKTTREQDQKFIRANRRAWHTQNYALNNVELPADVRSNIAANGSLDKNLIQAMDSDAKIREKKKQLEELLNNGNR